MNLVDIVGGKVVIHPDLYFIPAFKRLYEHDTSEDKVHQELVITYKYLCISGVAHIRRVWMLILEK